MGKAIHIPSPLSRAAGWLSQGDNAFLPLSFILVPPLVALIVIGLF